MDRMLNRRTFLKTSAASLPLAAAPDAESYNDLSGTIADAAISGATPKLMPLPTRLAPVDPATLPWQQNIRRVGQSNMTEHDPAVMNIEEWADYWHSAKADIVFISVTGILAFYPSKVKFHRHGKFLNGRDFFGECVAAAKKRGMRVVARMSPDLNWGDALEAHPEWAMRNKDGSVQFSGEEPRLFKTCMFSTYMDDYIPAIMREINSLYDVDCFYTNGWPPLGSLPECHCAICSKLPPPDTPAYWRVFNDRVLELWQQVRRHRQREEARQLLLREPRRQRARRAESRSPRQDRRLVPGRQPGPHLRRASRLGMQPARPRLQCGARRQICRQRDRRLLHRRRPLAQRLEKSRRSADVAERNLASGMVPYYHFVGSENGFGEDRRWQKVGADYFQLDRRTRCSSASRAAPSPTSAS